MNNKYRRKNKNINNLNLNKTFYHQKERNGLINYHLSADKDLTREIRNNHENFPIKLTTLFKDDHKKNRPQYLTKKEYKIFKNNKLSTKGKKYKKNRTSLNNEYRLTDNNNINNDIKLIKFIELSRDNINNKTNSKDKTFWYSGNNTYNTNANSNGYINTTGNNINNISKEIKNHNEEINVVNNSANLKIKDINEIPKSNIKIIEEKSNNNNNINNYTENNNKNKIDYNNNIVNNDNINNYLIDENISKRYLEEKPLREYYSLKDKIMENKKKSENLLNDSRKFYLYCNERGILSKLSQLKNKNIEKELKENGLNFENKKLNLYSEIKRLPTKVSFFKGNSALKDYKKDMEIYYKYNNDKFIKNLINKKYKGEAQKKSDSYHKIIINGFNKKKNKLKDEEIINNKLIINSNKENKLDKNRFVLDKDKYPLLNQKKILRNILPKQVDYNTQFTINDIINEEMHPLNRFQKRNLTLHSNLISQEIELLFAKNFRLTNLFSSSNIYLNTENYIEYKTGEKYNELLRKLIKIEEKENVVNPELIEDKMKINRRKYLLDKFMETMKKCMFKFKRLKISKEFFWEIVLNEEPINYKDGLYIFKAIKDGDIQEIEKVIKKNYKLATFRDEFLQTPLHICAKRNIYQVVKLFESRLADVNAQDAFGRTPLICAAQCGNLEFICVILFSMANPSIEDKNGKRAIDYANDHKIKFALNYARIVHIFNKMMNSLKNFDSFVKRGLCHLFGKELPINYEQLLDINDKIVNKNDNI